MNQNNLSIKELFKLAFDNHSQNNLEEAKILYKNILKSLPTHFESIYLLGTIYAQTQKYQNAEELLKKAISINPNFPEAHNNLGNVSQSLGKFQKAISSYRNAIKIKPDFAEAHSNLAFIFIKLNKFKEAISSYKNSITINPNNEINYYNLGNIFNQLGNENEAISYYQKAIKLKPDYAKAHNSLGYVFQKLYKYNDAITSYLKAIDLKPNYINAYINYGNILQKICKHEESIKIYEKIKNIDPNNITSYWASMNTFPIIYQTTKELDFYNKRFIQSINNLNDLLDNNIKFSNLQINEAINNSTNFFLHYQNKNNVLLQKKYALLIERLTRRIYPQFFIKKKKNKIIKFIKIGFISSFFRQHSVSNILKNWVLKINKNDFKIYIYYVGNEFDETTDLIKKYSSNFFNHTKSDKLINQIDNDNLDILVYLDIGIDPRIQILGSLKLAPIQCLAMGHPITSGFKNIDYVLSSELMEPNNAQEHYYEKLIMLPNLGYCYEKPLIKKTRYKIKFIKNNKTIFFNLQNLFKLLPEDDHIYIDIIKKNKECIFWFMQGKNNFMTDIFKNRMNKLFQKYKLSLDKYFIFHPRCDSNEFLNLIKQSDIILDSLNWSGYNTSHEVINLNKPIVTLPGKFMRGRHTYAILKMLNLEDLIATTKIEYVNIAVKLAKDFDFRNSIIDKIKNNKNKLFTDKKIIKFLEIFFIDVTRNN